MNIDMIHAAAQRLDGFIKKTPLLHSDQLDELAGRKVYIKAECLQHTGSFKVRGAWSAISALSPQIREKGVSAYSSGNHAQGVAYAARHHDCPAVILMPSDAPKIKVENTRNLGAEVVLFDRDQQDRSKLEAQIRAERGLTLIKPFDDPNVIAGQGTIGLEVAEQLREQGIDAAEMLICCGGGGLTSGIALALEQYAPDLTPRTVEPERFDDTARSLAAGQIVANDSLSGSLCDALLTPQPGELTFPIVQRLCGSGLVVSESEVLHAMALAHKHLNIKVEPGGAVALAAALFQPEAISGEAVVIVISGGNVDPEILERALAEF